MNKHVLLILRWLKNPESVTRKELDEHYDSLSYPNFHGSPEYELEEAYTFIYFGNVYNDVEICIDEYFRLSGENRADYEEELK